MNCSAKYVRKFADAQGRVTFTILGGSKGPGAAQIVGSYGRLFANGILLGHPVFAAYDLDGVRGVGPNDLSAWLSDWASGFSWARSDYDGDGILSPQDLSLLLGIFARGGSTQSCAQQCP